MSKPLLSIMLPTTIDRRWCFYKLLQEVLRQINEYGLQSEIEILIDEDNKGKSVGLKRQQLLEKASGEWVVGIDSDDWIAPTYIYDIMKALCENPDTDHVGFLEDCDIGGVRSMSIFSIRHKQWAENADGYDHVRCANPKSVIKRKVALQVGFEDSRYGEDRVFSEAVTPLLSKEVFINKPLYYYRYEHTPSNQRYGISL